MIFSVMAGHTGAGLQHLLVYSSSEIKELLPSKNQCFFASPPVRSSFSLSLIRISCSKSFHSMSRRHFGLKAVGLTKNLSSFRSSNSEAIFQCFGNTPLFTRSLHRANCDLITVIF